MLAKQKTSQFLDVQNANKIWLENKRIFARLKGIDKNKNHSLSNTYRSNTRSVSCTNQSVISATKFRSSERKHGHSSEFASVNMNIKKQITKELHMSSITKHGRQHRDNFSVHKFPGHGTYSQIKPTINLKDLKAHELAHKYYKNIAKRKHRVILQSDPLSSKRRQKALTSMLPKVSQPVKPKRFKSKKLSPVSTKNKVTMIDQIIEEPVITKKDQIIERNILEYLERKEASKFAATTVGNYTEMSTKSTSSIGHCKHQANVPVFNLNQIDEERILKRRFAKNAKQSQRSINHRFSKHSEKSAL
jgi:hypothetical protein